LDTDPAAEVCFVRFIEGETDPLERQTAEFSLMDSLQRCGIVAAEIEINEGGCFVIVPECHVAQLKTVFTELKAARAPFNAAIRVQEHCRRLLLQQSTLRNVLPTLGEVLAAMHRAGVCIVHAASAPSAISLVVNVADLHKAETVIAAF
jgi:hypothetical protein